MAPVYRELPPGTDEAGTLPNEVKMLDSRPFDKGVRVDCLDCRGDGFVEEYTDVDETRVDRCETCSGRGNVVVDVEDHIEYLVDEIRKERMGDGNIDRLYRLLEEIRVVSTEVTNDVYFGGAKCSA